MEAQSRTRTMRLALVFCLLIGLLFVGRASVADSDSAIYQFQCENSGINPYFEAMGHTFSVPDGFQVDEYNKNSLVLITTSTRLGISQMELQSVIIRYGPVDEHFHKNWKIVSPKDQLGLNFSAKTHTEEHAYGGKSFWVAFVGDDEQILISGLIPVEWQSFLNCIIS